MLSLITGPVGSGKTAELMHRLVACVRGGGRAVLIVPEQASFMAERDVYTALGSLAQHVRVTSFTRLSEKMMDEIGYGERIPLGTAGKYLLMAMAVDEVDDLLQVYRRHAYTAAFVEKLVEALDELRSAGVEASELARLGRSRDAGLSGPKLSELALLMDTYGALIENHFADGADLVQMAFSRAGEAEILRGAHVFIDAFAGFTAPEYRAIEAMLTMGLKLDITLCLEPGDPRYNIADGTLRRLRALTERLDMLPVDHSHLPVAHRFRSRAVAFVALQGMSATPLGQVGEGGQDIAFYRAKSPHDEMVFVASTISRLVRKEGYRYRDFTVMTRDLARYSGQLPAIFAGYGIPLFVDVETKASTKLLPGFLAAATAAAVGRDGMNPIFYLAKSPAMDIEPEAAGEFENYCFTWSVTPKDLESPFENAIDGFVEHMSDRQVERLAMAEGCRRALWAHIATLREHFAGGRARDYAAGLFALLQSVDFGERMDAFSRDLAPDARRDFLDEQALLWDAMVEILELFGGVMGDVALAPARFLELLTLCIESVPVALPPRTLDEVTVATVDRSRPDSPRAVFLIGAVEGEFPRSGGGDRLLGEPERRYMAGMGFDLIRDADYLYDLEVYNCTLALGGPSERLYITYPAATAAGEPLEPSFLYLGTQALIETPCVYEAPPGGGIYSLKSAYMALGGDVDAATGASLRAFIAGRGEGERLARLDELAARAPRRLMPSQGGLFGSRLRLSPTQVERFHNCPFSYFMRDGLRVRPRRRAELSPLESGNLIHEIVSAMTQRHGGKGLSQLSDEAMGREVEAIAETYLKERLSDKRAIDGRFRYLFGRMVEAATRLVRHLADEFAQSGFEPVASELVVGEGGVPPLSLRTPGGRTITVEGRVDRVDVAEQDGVRYLRVVDYKSGGKDFKLSDVFYGLNMQMLIYLFAIEKNAGGQLAGALPAGVLYMPTISAYLRMDRDVSADKAAAEHRKSYRMNGLILDDPAAITAMDPEGTGIFVPLPRGKSAGEGLASFEEMGRLRLLVEHRIAEMADHLGEGHIEARPAVAGPRSACDYCDYRTVCGHEPGDDVKYLRTLKKDEVIGGEAHG